MDTFEDLIKPYISEELKDEIYFHPLGKYYAANTKIYQGYYWYYETDDFIIDIHNLFILEDYVKNEIISIQDIDFISNFVISGNGEYFNPYQVIEPFSIFVIDPSDKNNKCLIHKNSRLFLVGIKFKKTFFLKHYISYDKLNYKDNLKEMFYQSKNSITNLIYKIAKDILTCKLENDKAKIFFEDKAKEWFYITIKACEDLKKQKNLSNLDKKLIENVGNYISDHYSSNISQKLLEKIACMCGTKLKKTFKKRYQLSITEYTQRKRINMAEQLLLNTDLKIKYIAKTVGYNSSSRFANLYKRYKGVYPLEVKKMIVLSEKIKNSIK